MIKGLRRNQVVQTVTVTGISSEFHGPKDAGACRICTLTLQYLNRNLSRPKYM